MLIFILPRPKTYAKDFGLRLKTAADVRLCFGLVRSFTRKNQTGCPHRALAVVALHYIFQGLFRMREISKLKTLQTYEYYDSVFLTVKTG